MECYLVRKVTKPVNELSTSDWPRLTGMTVSDNKIYITYYLTDETKKPSVTRYINKAYVAVYSYPELEYITTMEDKRAAIAGSWNAYNGIFQTESGDMYTFSNTSIANGFTENSTKNSLSICICLHSLEKMRRWMKLTSSKRSWKEQEETFWHSFP